MAPGASAYDSEQSMSSDADTLSLTDGSVDGAPPFRCRKLHRREMHESAKANGQVPLPHIPRTNRRPKDMHVAPERFAADLICRLEGVVRERDAQERLEERLRRVRLEEEGDEADSPGHPQQGGLRHGDAVYDGAPPRDTHEENPESILDDHVQRVMRSPGRRSPMTLPPEGRPGPGHHHAHHPPREQGEAEGAARWQGGFPWSTQQHHHGARSRVYPDGTEPNNTDSLAHTSKGSAAPRRLYKKGEELRPHDPTVPPEEVERNQKILVWMMEGEKESVRHKKIPYGRAQGHEPSWPSSVERPGAVHPWVSAQLRNNVQPSHPFIQDPTMPPNPAPNPLTQLEEARRRLLEEEEEDEKKKKSGAMTTKQRHKGSKRPVCESVTVAYFFCGEPIPYRTLVKGGTVTLGQFKELLTKKGNYRYYFKKVSDEFDCGVVFEEVHEDDAVLPIFKEKIIGKVEKID